MEERSIDELRAIAKAMNISKISRLTAQEIVYKILDSQAKEEAKTTEQENISVAVKKPRTRLKPKPIAESNTKKAEATADTEAIETPKTQKKATKQKAKISEPEIKELKLKDIPEIPKMDDLFIPDFNPLAARK